jgi:hypothetical protein
MLFVFQPEGTVMINSKRCRGQGMTEYIVVVALVAVAAIGVGSAIFHPESSREAVGPPLGRLPVEQDGNDRHAIDRDRLPEIDSHPWRRRNRLRDSAMVIPKLTARLAHRHEDDVAGVPAERGHLGPRGGQKARRSQVAAVRRAGAERRGVAGMYR